MVQKGTLLTFNNLLEHEGQRTIKGHKERLHEVAIMVRYVIRVHSIYWKDSLYQIMIFLSFLHHDVLIVKQ